MSDPSDGKILIKFEIHVPVGAQAPVVIQPAAAAPAAPPAAPPSPSSPPPASALASPIGVPAVILVPSGVTLPNGTANVKVSGTNAVGVICVTKSLENGANGVPLNVYLKIYPVSVSHEAPPLASQTPSGVQATALGTNSTYSRWKHDAVPDAQCTAPSTGFLVPNNKLVVWRLFSGWTNWAEDVVYFPGVCSNLTDCEVGTNGLFASATQTIETASGGLQVVARGFGGTLQPLNGTWVLRRVPQSADGSLSWVSGGDGMQQPRAEVTGNCCGSDAMELRFSCSGRQLVYRVSREQFRPLGASLFVWCDQGTALAGCDFPRELQVIPAMSP